MKCLSLKAQGRGDLLMVANNGLAFRVESLGFRVEGLEFRVEGLEFRV